ncbi:sugar ABC transporter ATP-binding protein [Actinobacteria bacterium YIM 96077]|uniref:Sugar ABC transporter ATP-binding protein n=1 Tax=Phytoactinopolyspora halophila TaxID=1981511 RepID=A0A329QT21_9ACTN|nr:sugar ABC transporter ATP-binding protein [Phytoactinopolyspora halophila]AYY13898.1 sugar ABC transporter ATP-binding protein [Actinobacteria bacterium YIM 96077]RAW15560.1 sugar ABC transporter ATP-binding protein [Phytoactinopolyspora halophila]
MAMTRGESGVQPPAGAAGGLVCRGLTKSFPGIRALDGVDVDVPYGSVEVILGENGAGKSTLMKILSGVHGPDSGSMTLDGQEYRPATPKAAIAAGVAMIHQEMNLVPGMSVAENIFLGRQPRRRGGVDYREMTRAATDIVRRVGLRVDVTRPVGSLSVAAQQQVEIAKALSLEARILILDEPTAALGAEESERLFEIVDELRADGVGFAYITHRLREVERVGDRVVVMRDGRRVASWDRADVDVDTLVEAMVDRTVDQVYPEPRAPESGELLRVEGLGRAGAFSGVSFTLHRGEVLGIAGLVGAGRTELARALFGAEPADRGRIVAGDRELEIASPIDAIEAGIVLVPEDRKASGLVLGMPVQDNVALPSLRDLTDGGVVRRSRVRDMARNLAQRFDIRGRPGQAAGTLSGGNHRRIARRPGWSSGCRCRTTSHCPRCVISPTGAWCGGRECATWPGTSPSGSTSVAGPARRPARSPAVISRRRSSPSGFRSGRAW